MLWRQASQGVIFHPIARPLRPRGRRWGGTPSSRYNWRLGNAWNAAADWFFANVNYSGQKEFGWQQFLEENRQHQVQAAITLPMLGWVARDRVSYAYPVAAFGPQRRVAQQNADMGDGFTPAGEPLEAGDPRRTSVPAPPQFIGDWVREIRRFDAQHHSRSVALYQLDNEPALWHLNHRDVHPQPVSYDELLKRTLAYGAAVRQADPTAMISGPAAWGWPEYFFSGQDVAAGLSQKPDRMMHEDSDLLAWYLRALRDHESRTGKRLLNVLDVHYVPQGGGLLGDAAAAQDKEDEPTALRRLRATRSLWDPSYVDESWIDERIFLLPRLRAMAAQHYPGTQLAIGAYHFGGEHAVSGALAQAEALGRFASEGLYAAYTWPAPIAGGSLAAGFAAYRNFDGQGGHFGDRLLSTVGDRAVSVFASRDGATGKIVVVALNLDPHAATDVTVELRNCGQIKRTRMFDYTEAAATALRSVPAERLQSSGPAATRTELAPFSLNVLEWTVR